MDIQMSAYLFNLSESDSESDTISPISSDLILDAICSQTIIPANDKQVKYQNISPSALKLVVITSCNCNLNCNINLNVIYACLDPDNDDIIKKVELENRVKGECKSSKVVRKNKKKSVKEKKKKHFINQITIVLNYLEAKINVKLFGNGKMVITGAKSVDVLKQTLGVLVNKIRELSLPIQLNSTIGLEKIFSTPGDAWKFIEKNHLLILDLIVKVNLQIPINWLAILTNREKKESILSESSFDVLINQHLFTSTSNLSTDLSNFIRLIQTVKLIKNYSYNFVHPAILNDALKYYSGEQIHVKTSYQQLPQTSDLQISVNNYNALFESNVKFDREKFHHVLTNECEILVNYRPSSYQGLNITYYLNHAGEREKVTFFVFQDGTIMITGNKNWEAITESYHQMCQLIDKYYDQIVNTDDDKKNRVQSPTRVEKVIDGENYVFLHKRDLIYNHPRNNYLLKTKGLIATWGSYNHAE